MCCCGCALAMLTEESRTAPPAGAGMRHNEAPPEAVQSASGTQSSVWQLMTRWFSGAPRPLVADVSAVGERSNAG